MTREELDEIREAVDLAAGGALRGDWPDTIRALLAEVERLHGTALEPDGTHNQPGRSWDDCPTFYDGCHCTVENLIHNVKRAEKAEAEVERLREGLRGLEKGGVVVVRECRAMLMVNWSDVAALLGEE